MQVALNGDLATGWSRAPCQRHARRWTGVSWAWRVIVLRWSTVPNWGPRPGRGVRPPAHGTRPSSPGRPGRGWCRTRDYQTRTRRHARSHRHDRRSDPGPARSLTIPAATSALPQRPDATPDRTSDRAAGQGMVVPLSGTTAFRSAGMHSTICARRTGDSCTASGGGGDDRHGRIRSPRRAPRPKCR